MVGVHYLECRQRHCKVLALGFVWFLEIRYIRRVCHCFSHDVLFAKNLGWC